jgi:DNA-binding NarL/FixJ family response regulator
MLAASSPVDLVLSDLRLRGAEDGIAAIRSLRQTRPNLPALLVSGDTAPQRLLDADAANLTMLHKPVPVGVLTRAIREQIDRMAPGHMA